MLSQHSAGHTLGQQLPASAVTCAQKLAFQSADQKASSEVQDEIEPSSRLSLAVGNSHQKFGQEEIIDKVAGLAGKVKLSRQDRSLRRLDFQVVVARAARIEPRHYRSKPVSAVLTRVQVTAVAKAGIVVVAILISVPKVEQSTWYRAAASRENEALKLEDACARSLYDKIRTFGRTRLEKWPLDRGFRRFVGITAFPSRRAG